MAKNNEPKKSGRLCSSRILIRNMRGELPVRGSSLAPPKALDVLIGAGLHVSEPQAVRIVRDLNTIIEEVEKEVRHARPRVLHPNLQL